MKMQRVPTASGNQPQRQIDLLATAEQSIDHLMHRAVAPDDAANIIRCKIHRAGDLQSVPRTLAHADVEFSTRGVKQRLRLLQHFPSPPMATRGINDHEEVLGGHSLKSPVGAYVGEVAQVVIDPHVIENLRDGFKRHGQTVGPAKTAELAAPLEMRL